MVNCYGVAVLNFGLVLLQGVSLLCLVKFVFGLGVFFEV